MKGVKKVLCAAFIVVAIGMMSIPAFAANGAKDGTGPSPIQQQLKDGTDGGGGNGGGGNGSGFGGGGDGFGGNGGGAKDGTGPLRDGSGGNLNCPYLQ
ncbi:MAG: hypothetical protein LBU61_04950 [Coriobacteriales bacterium]|jgi:hypothetical protein|nr:hypothetical protein [Coriobacteriales bacterium]